MLWRSFAIALVFACITAGFAALRIVLAFDYVWMLLLTFVAFMLALFGVIQTLVCSWGTRKALRMQHRGKDLEAMEDIWIWRHAIVFSKVHVHGSLGLVGL